MSHSDAIIEKLRTLKPTLQKDMGIRRLRVFGSVASVNIFGGFHHHPPDAAYV